MATGPARTNDLDAKIEELLTCLVNVQRQRYERWRVRLVEVLGPGLGGPADRAARSSGGVGLRSNDQ
ncbi:MAG: hypothetical protein ACLQOO_18535 [Terriglobia bacterium]